MTLIAALLYFSIVNVAAASLHFIDEVSTLYGGRGFRTPDYAHLLLSLLGGWLAAFAVRRALRRKPRPQAFETAFWAAAAVNVATVLAASMG